MTVKGSALAYTRVAPSELFSSLLGLYLPMKLPSSSIPAATRLRHKHSTWGRHAIEGGGGINTK